jgi:GNAT superfamily N-acetyltransferase
MSETENETVSEPVITIRPGRLSDLPAEASLNHDTDWCYDEANMVAEYHDDAYEPSSVLIAEVDGKLVGKLELFIAWKSIYGKFGVIRRFVVHPEHRSQGVGRVLFDAATEHARESGCSFIELSVDVTNPIPHSFYHRQGFREDRVEVLMRKPLTEQDASSNYTAQRDAFA